MNKYFFMAAFIFVVINCYAEIHKDRNGNEYNVKNAFDLPIGNYIHPDGYYEDIYYNSGGFKVLDVYYAGGPHTITTSKGRGEFLGWVSQGVSGGFVYAPDKLWDEYFTRWFNRYNTDIEFKKLVNLCIAIADNSRYDWDFWYNGVPHDTNRGFICDDYASLVKEVFTAGGYDVKIASSQKANHTWNEVILPDGRKVYIDATWFDYDYDNTDRQWKEQEYSIPWIVFEEDKKIFDHGFTGKRMEHYAFGDVQYR
ncbi:hypothetical protein AGMMS49546_01320 [Spirochaetia bacterium]|nr:hypothetical protein AGMMS49546_01320 [Spirochaetia bacterium]